MDLSSVLEIDKYNLKDLCMKIKEILISSFPPSECMYGRYNPGMTLE